MLGIEDQLACLGKAVISNNYWCVSFGRPYFASVLNKAIDNLHQFLTFPDQFPDGDKLKNRSIQ